MAPDGTATTLWEGFPDGSTMSRPDIPLNDDADFELAVADNGDIFASDPYRHAIYKLDPSTGQSTVIAGEPGEAGNAD
jgi:streptogramin lyase